MLPKTNQSSLWKVGFRCKPCLNTLSHPMGNGVTWGRVNNTQGEGHNGVSVHNIPSSLVNQNGFYCSYLQRNSTKIWTVQSQQKVFLVLVCSVVSNSVSVTLAAMRRSPAETAASFPPAKKNRNCWRADDVRGVLSFREVTISLPICTSFSELAPESLPPAHAPMCSAAQLRQGKTFHTFRSCCLVSLNSTPYEPAIRIRGGCKKLQKTKMEHWHS